jgi:hypothetical protein
MKKVVKNWTAEEIAFQEWLAAPKRQRSPKTQGAVAEQIGVTEETLSRWKKQDGWQSAVAESARRYLGDDLPEIYAALAREAKKGSAPHIKLALIAVGEYVEQSDVTSGGRPISAPTVYLPAVADQDSERGE